MKIISNDQALRRHNNKFCTVTEYDIQDKDLDFAIIKITGRYPEERRVINIECKEVAYVHEGQGTIEINGKGHALKAGDLVLVEAGEKFCWEGNMTLFISCHHAFSLDQHHEVD